MKDLLLVSLRTLVVYFTPYENIFIHKYLYNKVQVKQYKSLKINKVVIKWFIY